jgi:hypothetical protein
MNRKISRRFRPTMTPEFDQLESRGHLSTGFQVATSPTAAGLNAVAAVSPTDIFAVGDQGTTTLTTLVENFNGTTWSKETTPTPAGSSFSELNAVGALSSTDVWAVGESSAGPLVEFFNGKTWSIQATPSGGGVLNSVTAHSPTDVWAVGSTSLGSGTGYLIEHFDGTSWSISFSTSANRASLTGISAVSPTDIYAVGSTKNTGTQILHFDGSTWSTLATSASGLPGRAIDAISDSDIWVVGDGGTANFNGTAWTQVPDAVGGDLAAITGSSPNDLFAVGETLSTTDEPLVEQWNGSTWSVVTSAEPNSNANSFSGVTTLSNGTTVAVGSGFIESNATTATPAFRPSAVVPLNTGGTPVANNLQMPGNVVSPDGTSAPPESSPAQDLVFDDLDVLQILRQRRNRINLG